MDIVVSPFLTVHLTNTGTKEQQGLEILNLLNEIEPGIVKDIYEYYRYNYRKDMLKNKINHRWCQYEIEQILLEKKLYLNIIANVRWFICFYGKEEMFTKIYKQKGVRCEHGLWVRVRYLKALQGLKKYDLGERKKIDVLDTTLKLIVERYKRLPNEKLKSNPWKSILKKHKLKDVVEAWKDIGLDFLAVTSI